MRFREGDRVYLVPFWMYGKVQPGEWAEVIAYEGLGLYMVRVEDPYREDSQDDGIREVMVGEMRAL